MNEKEIQSISLSQLLQVYERRPEDIYLEGCVITSHFNVNNVNVNLFQYPTRINAFVIVICSQGSISFTSGVTRHTLEGKTLFINFPGTILQTESVQSASIHAIICEEEFFKNLHLDFKLISEFFLHIEKHPYLSLSEEEWLDLDRSFQDFHREGNARHTDPYSQEILRSMILIFAYKICRIINRHIAINPLPETSPRNRNNEYFNQFIVAISKHCTQERSVGFYAEMLHLTPKYLTTIIRKTSGRTAIQWIDDYVILEAKNLLKHSTMSIQEIAYYLNFPNQSSFGKYFRNHTGMTPSAYKQIK